MTLLDTEVEQRILAGSSVSNTSCEVKVDEWVDGFVSEEQRSSFGELKFD